MTPANFIELFFERTVCFYEAFMDLMLFPIDIIINILKDNRKNNGE